jgi:hypothetical protein
MQSNKPMSKLNILQYSLAFGITIFVMSSYLMFLAHRDSQMMNYYDSTIESRVRE